MKDLEYKKILERGSFGFAHFESVCFNSCHAPALIFRAVNPAFEKLIGLQSKDLLKKSLTDIHPDIDSGTFPWIRFLNDVAKSGSFREHNAYYPPLKRWFHVQAIGLEDHHIVVLINDISKEKLIAESSRHFLEESEPAIAYQKICDYMHIISGARFTGFNIYEHNELEFTTVAVSGMHDISCKIADILGYDLTGKKWNFAPFRLKVIKKKSITRFNSIRVFARRLLSESTLDVLESTFNPGEIYIVKIEKDGRLLGDFTTVMPNGETLANEMLIDIFTQQVGLILERQEIEKELTHFFNINLDILTISDLQGNFIRVSKELENLLGYTTVEVEKNSLLDYVHPKDISKTKKALRRLAHQETITGFINRYIKKDGDVRYLEWRCQPSGSRVYSAARDITKRILDEKAIRRQSEMQELMVSLAASYINVPINEMESLINKSLAEIARFAHADRAYIFEFDRDKYLCRNTHEWCAAGISSHIDELQDIPLEIIEQRMGIDGKCQLFEIHTIQDISDEEYRELLEKQHTKSLITIPLMRNGTCIGYVGFDSVNEHRHYCDREKMLLKIFAEMLVNMSKRAELEQQLIIEKENAQEANKTKNAFLANMSHEIRTPLNGVIGFTDLLKSTPLSALQHQYIDNVHVSAKTLMSIVNDILDLSKIESGKLQLEPVKSDLFLMIEQIWTMFSYQASEKNLTLKKSVDKSSPRFALIDPVRLKQVLVNLIGNAIKFTEKGSVQLTVEFSQTEKNRVKYLFSVSDTGIGISQKQKEKIFQAFSHGDASITQRFGGVGLGLVISNHLVNKMGSSIKLKSTPAKGATFSFMIETTIYPE